MDIQNLKQKIMLKSFNCGISSDEVSNAKLIVNNKLKNSNLFVCEGLWAVDKLIEKNIKVREFFFNMDKINSGKIDEKSIEKIAKMVKEIGKEIDIEVDGGITKDNAKAVKDAGANVLVAGSTVFNEPDRAAVIKYLREV